MSVEFADILRRLAFGQAFVIGLLTAWTITRYIKKAYTAPPPERALPIHVALIGTSYLIMVGYVVFSLTERLGSLPTWRIPASLASFTFGIAALAFMMSHLSARRILVAAFERRLEAETAKEVKRQIERTEHRMQRMEEVNRHTHDTVAEINENVIESTHKAEAAFHEANNLNTKIYEGTTKVHQSLEKVQDEAATAKATAKEVSVKADLIGETGKDTNVRVRNIEDLTPNSDVKGGQGNKSLDNQEKLH